MQNFNLFFTAARRYIPTVRSSIPEGPDILSQCQTIRLEMNLRFNSNT